VELEVRACPVTKLACPENAGQLSGVFAKARGVRREGDRDSVFVECARKELAASDLLEGDR
jgi:hypothetical protein